jgi:hypothetical protein
MRRRPRAGSGCAQARGGPVEVDGRGAGEMRRTLEAGRAASRSEVRAAGSGWWRGSADSPVAGAAAPREWRGVRHRPRCAVDPPAWLGRPRDRVLRRGGAHGCAHGGLGLFCPLPAHQARPSSARGVPGQAGAIARPQHPSTGVVQDGWCDRDPGVSTICVGAVIGRWWLLLLEAEQGWWCSRCSRPFETDCLRRGHRGLVVRLENDPLRVPVDRLLEQQEKPADVDVSPPLVRAEGAADASARYALAAPAGIA